MPETMRAVAVLLTAVLVRLPAAAQDAPAKRTFFWFRMWPDQIVKYDVEKDEVVARTKLKNGVCHGSWLSHDKKRLFAITGQRAMVEVIDLAKAEVVDEHPFKQDGYIVRIDTIRECPGGQEWYVKVNRIKNELDHFTIEKPEWLHYSLPDREVKKKMKDLPRAIRRGARISPDGRKWHVFGRDITVVDPATLKEEGKIVLSEPPYAGMGGFSVRGEDLRRGDDPASYRMLYTMRDPVKKNRSLFGIVDISIPELKVTALKELGADPRGGDLRVTRDGKRAIGQSWGRGGRGGGREGEDPKIQLAMYDLESGARVKSEEVTVRNGLGLAGISPDGRKVYLAGRGHELVILDGDFKPLKTVAMEGEIDGSMILTEE